MTKPRCKHCGSTHVYGISRVVGYFSKIEDWNASKSAEFRHRQKGDYGVTKQEQSQKEMKEVQKVAVNC